MREWNRCSKRLCKPGLDMLNLKKLITLNGKKGLKNKLKTFDLNRPGITLAGYFRDFAFDRIQLFGRGEYDYLIHLQKDKRRTILKKFCSYDIPCCIFALNNQPDEIFIKQAEQFNIPLLSVNLPTHEIAGILHDILEKRFSPQQQFHGVMIEVFGMGVLILGKSGVGKSECALELITKGHRLIADDLVYVNKIGGSTLIAQGSDLIKHHIEIQGIGIIDIQSLFGSGSVGEGENVDIVVLLEEWGKDKKYERIGIDERFYEILGVKVPFLVIPVKPGRNVAVIIEAAVRNKRLREMGIVSSLILDNKVKNLMKSEK